MNKLGKKQLIVLFTILMIVTLALTACGSASATPTSAPAATAAQVTTAAPAATDTTAAAGSCLVGTWQLADFSTYMNSVESKINTSSTDTVMTDQGSTGSALFNFDANGNAKLTADNFEEKFNMTVNANSSNMDIPIVLTLNGITKSGYTVSGDEITFSMQDLGDLLINVTVMGTTSPVDNDLMGTLDTVKLYQYSCVDANTLSLKVIATNIDLAPLMLTRVQ